MVARCSVAKIPGFAVDGAGVHMFKKQTSWLRLPAGESYMFKARQGNISLCSSINRFPGEGGESILLAQAWQGGLAVRAGVVARMIINREKTGAFNQHCPATWAEGVFSLFTRDVAGVDKMQSAFKPDVAGATDGFNRGGSAVFHLECGMKACDMPWHIGIDAGDKPGDLPQFFCRVVPSWNNEGCDFNPDSELFHEGNGFKYRFQPGAADLVIKAVSECLQVDIVGGENWGDGAGCLFAGVTVRNENVQDSCVMGELGGLKGELKEDRWFNISVADAGATGLGGFCDNLSGSRSSAGDASGMKGWILRDFEVLAVKATEVAPNGCDRIRK